MGFFLKLWRGGVSLQTTYWIFGALVVSMFEVLDMVPLGEGGGEKTLTFISSAYYLFIAVAIFRSSIRHTGSRLFIIYAQLSALGLILVVLARIFFPGGIL